MNDQEKELLEGFRRLPADSQNFILSTVITAITAQDALWRELGRGGIRSPTYALQGPGPVMGAQGATHA